MLIHQCGVVLETPDVNYGRTAAHWATYYHRDDILEELIIAGMYMRERKRERERERERESPPHHSHTLLFNR